ncbi:ABC transporter substrate-binding protein [Rhodobacter sp. 24-YEA-8]|uniref:ABC transporter substrate-binding protein n=1 Tax=Rhodobacter sp. 24-YEA-8 TaxID=1884310 RepID=UPI0008996BBA|nr:ABC transporter substrate-binding protein [Rhodobacter sp. 24-YEA-8]SEB55491.1 iron complex transport system substrate-binding protein [Rhodobacter sp. 24-YEA-8]
MLRAATLVLLFGALPVAADPLPPPGRVVSINLCTDQLAMMLAAPGQLVSVSHLASDPLASSMPEEAAAYTANRGGAEQVFLMTPGLVLAGTYTARASVDLLRRLGIRVEQVTPVTSLEGVSAQIREVAGYLGREAAGEALVAEFEAGLAALATDLALKPAALYYPNGYTTGKGTLSDDVLAHTGFANIGAVAGVTGGGVLPMELLVMAQPDLVVTSKPYPGASRSEEILDHPALALLQAEAGLVAFSDADWICGTPHILRAVAAMRAARLGLEAASATKDAGERAE